jgi:Flp pilus assembly protein TadD
VKTPIIAGILALGAGLLTLPSWAATAEQLRQTGLNYRQQERYPEAIAALKQAVALDPQNVSGRVLLGWTQHRAGQEAEATETLEQTLALNPFEVTNLNALGIVHLVSGRLPAAIVTHGWAALLKPENEIAHYNLSLGFERLGQYNWAIATAKTAAKLEPSNPHPLVALALAHWGNGDRALAQQVYRQAIGVDGRYGDSGFLNYLNEAGFSADQIQRSKQVLQSSR